MIEQLETDSAAIDQQYAGVKGNQAGPRATEAEAGRRQGPNRHGRADEASGRAGSAQVPDRSLDTAAQLFVTPDTDRFLSQISTAQSQRESEFGTPGLPTGASERALEHSTEVDLAALAEKELKSRPKPRTRRSHRRRGCWLTASQRQQISDAEKNETARANAAGRAATSRSSTRGSATSSGRGARNGLCEGAARRPIRSQWRWTELVGLLRLDNACGDRPELACRTRPDSSTAAAAPWRGPISS